MRSIGIRVSPKEINFCVTEVIDDEIEIIGIDKLLVPKALDVPRQLAYIRTNIISILKEYKISNAGIRIHEGNTQNLSIDRIYLEGVIQELFANCNVNNYFRATLSKMGSILGEKPQKLKDYISGEIEIFPIEGINKSAREVRECVLTSVCTSEHFKIYEVK